MCAKSTKPHSRPWPPSRSAARNRTAEPAPAPLAFASATPQDLARVCVVAEIGVNHDGSLAKALDLITAAAEAKVDAVKFQLFDPRHLLSNQAALAKYQEGQASDVFAMLDGLKLTEDDLLAVRMLARRMGLHFIVTPFSLEDIPALARLEVDAVKIASPDAVNLPLLAAAGALGKPMLVSTGTAELEELAPAAKLLQRHPAPVCLLQCVSAYPAPLAQAGLGGIEALAQRFNLPVGYSDHTCNPFTGALAVAAGACVIEKHMTYNPEAVGPDHAASFGPAQMCQYVMLVRQATQALGVRAKTCQAAESDVRQVSRQSVCVTRTLPAGHVLTRADLTVKRPGTGIPAAQLETVIGRTLCRDVAANDLLTPRDLV